MDIRIWMIRIKWSNSMNNRIESWKENYKSIRIQIEVYKTIIRNWNSRLERKDKEMIDWISNWSRNRNIRMGIRNYWVMLKNWNWRKNERMKNERMN